MLTQTAQTGDKPKYSATKILIMVFLFVPWIFIDVLLKKHDPSLGYALGIFIGVVSGYLLSPGSPKIWVIALLAAVLAINHYVFVPYYVCAGGN